MEKFEVIRWGLDQSQPAGGLLERKGAVLGGRGFAVEDVGESLWFEPRRAATSCRVVAFFRDCNLGMATRRLPTATLTQSKQDWPIYGHERPVSNDSNVVFTCHEAWQKIWL